jgi:hypothetical protein
MLLASGILVSAGSFFIFIGAFLQANRLFYVTAHGHNPPGQVFGGIEEPADDWGSWISRRYRKTKWLNSFRTASIRDARIIHSWELIIVGSGLDLVGALLTVIVALSPALPPR